MGIMRQKNPAIFEFLQESDILDRAKKFQTTIEKRLKTIETTFAV